MCVDPSLDGKTTDIPLLLLILVALVAGSGAAVLARRWMPTGIEADADTGIALTLALVPIFGGGLVLAVLALVVRGTDALAGIDGSVARWGADHASSWSTQGLKLVTDLGETWTAIVVGLVVTLADWRRTGNRWTVVFLLAVVIGDKLLTNGLKDVVGRVRPDLNPIAATLGPSFPSGHSSTAAAFWAATALVVGRWGKEWRTIAPMAAAAVAVAVAVAASRVLLDLHWLTDVIAGLILGWTWFAACAVAFGTRLRRIRAAAVSPGAAPEIGRG